MAYIGISVIAPGLSARAGATYHVTLAHFDKPTDEQAVKIAEELYLFAGGGLIMGDHLKSASLEHWDRVGDVLVLQSDPRIDDVRRAVLHVLASMSIAVSSHYAFLPHVTLGKVSREIARESLIKDIKELYYGVAAHGLELCGAPVITRYYFPLRHPPFPIE